MQFLRRQSSRLLGKNEEVSIPTKQTVNVPEARRRFFARNFVDELGPASHGEAIRAAVNKMAKEGSGVLSLRKVDLTDTHLRALVAALRSDPVVAKLDLRENRISDRGAKLLVQLMEELFAKAQEEWAFGKQAVLCIQEVQIKGNAISEEIAEDLSRQAERGTDANLHLNCAWAFLRFLDPDNMEAPPRIGLPWAISGLLSVRAAVDMYFQKQVRHRVVLQAMQELGLVESGPSLGSPRQRRSSSIGSAFSSSSRTADIVDLPCLVRYGAFVRLILLLRGEPTSHAKLAISVRDVEIKLIQMYKLVEPADAWRGLSMDGEDHTELKESSAADTSRIGSSIPDSGLLMESSMLSSHIAEESPRLESSLSRIDSEEPSKLSGENSQITVSSPSQQLSSPSRGGSVRNKSSVFSKDYDDSDDDDDDDDDDRSSRTSSRSSGSRSRSQSSGSHSDSESDVSSSDEDSGSNGSSNEDSNSGSESGSGSESESESSNSSRSRSDSSSEESESSGSGSDSSDEDSEHLRSQSSSGFEEPSTASSKTSASGSRLTASSSEFSKDTNRSKLSARSSRSRHSKSSKSSKSSRSKKKSKKRSERELTENEPRRLDAVEEEGEHTEAEECEGDRLGLLQLAASSPLEQRSIESGLDSFSQVESVAITELDFSGKDLESLQESLENVQDADGTLCLLRASRNILGTNVEIRCFPPQRVFSQLHTLDLAYNSFRRLDMELLPETLPSLKVLDVSHNELKTLRGLDRMDSLLALRAGYNCIRDASYLAGLSSLRSLDLRNNQISKTTALRGLALNVNLEDLWLKENPVAQNNRYRAQMIHLLPSLQDLDGVSLPPSSTMRKNARRNAATNTKDQATPPPRKREVDMERIKKLSEPTVQARFTPEQRALAFHGASQQSPSKRLERAKLDAMLERLAKPRESLGTPEKRRIGLPMPAFGSSEPRHSVIPEIDTSLDSPKRRPNNTSPVHISKSLLTPTNAFRRKTIQGMKDTEEECRREMENIRADARRERRRRTGSFSEKRKKRSPRARLPLTPSRLSRDTTFDVLSPPPPPPSSAPPFQLSPPPPPPSSEAPTLFSQKHPHVARRGQRRGRMAPLSPGFSSPKLEAFSSLHDQGIDDFVQSGRLEDWMADARQQRTMTQTALSVLERISHNKGFSTEQFADYRERLVDVGLWQRLEPPPVQTIDSANAEALGLHREVEIAKAAVRNFVQLLETEPSDSENIANFRDYLMQNGICNANIAGALDENIDFGNAIFTEKQGDISPQNAAGIDTSQIEKSRQAPPPLTQELPNSRFQVQHRFETEQKSPPSPQEDLEAVSPVEVDKKKDKKDEQKLSDSATSLRQNGSKSPQPEATVQREHDMPLATMSRISSAPSPSSPRSSRMGAISLIKSPSEVTMNSFESSSRITSPVSARQVTGKTGNLSSSQNCQQGTRHRLENEVREESNMIDNTKGSIHNLDSTSQDGTTLPPTVRFEESSISSPTSTADDVSLGSATSKGSRIEDGISFSDGLMKPQQKDSMESLSDAGSVASSVPSPESPALLRPSAISDTQQGVSSTRSNRFPLHDALTLDTAIAKESSVSSSQAPPDSSQAESPPPPPLPVRRAVADEKAISHNEHRPSLDRFSPRTKELDATLSGEEDDSDDDNDDDIDSERGSVQRYSTSSRSSPAQIITRDSQAPAASVVSPPHTGDSELMTPQTPKHQKSFGANNAGLSKSSLPTRHDKDDNDSSNDSDDDSLPPVTSLRPSSSGSGTSSSSGGSSHTHGSGNVGAVASSTTGGVDAASLDERIRQMLAQKGGSSSNSSAPVNVKGSASIVLTSVAGASTQPPRSPLTGESGDSSMPDAAPLLQGSSQLNLDDDDVDNLSDYSGLSDLDDISLPE